MQTTFEAVLAYVTNPANYERTAKARRADARQAATLEAKHAEWTANRIAQGYRLDADGEVDPFSVFE